MNTMRLLLLPALACALTACSAEAPAPAPVRPVLSVIAEPSASTQAGFVGVVAPQNSVEQSFRLGGTLLTRGVEVGDQVSVGQALASVDATTYELSLETARANSLTAEAQYANATATEGRLRTLNQSDVVAIANLQDAEQQTEAARAALVQARSRVTQATEQLAYTSLTASIDGVVTAVGAEPGAVIAAGQSVVTIAQPQSRDLVIDVPEEVVGTLSLGTPFLVAPQLVPDAIIEGTLREIAPQADAVTRTWRLRIGLKDPTDHFWLGTTATAYLDEGSADAIFLPLTAIRTSDDTTQVWVVNETSGTVSLRPVTLGPQQSGMVPILSGVEAGDRIVIAGVNTLQDGQHVRIDGDSAQ